MRIRKRKLCMRPLEGQNYRWEGDWTWASAIAHGFLSHERHTIPHPAINKTPRPRVTAACGNVRVRARHTGAREKLSKFAYRVDFHPEDADSRTIGNHRSRSDRIPCAECATGPVIKSPVRNNIHSAESAHFTFYKMKTLLLKSESRALSPSPALPRV